MTSYLNDNIAKRMFNYANNASQELTDKVKGVLVKSDTAKNILPGDDPTYKGWGANPQGNPTLTPQPEEKNNTMLYVGIGAGLLAVWYFFIKD